MIQLDDMFNEHRKALQYGLGKVDPTSFQLAVETLCNTIDSGGRIFAAGNGGSASIADHLACDFFKGSSNGTVNPQAMSLVNNIALLTAIANDFSYDDLFTFQLERYVQTPERDCVILISSSGNSVNILNAVNYCRFHGISTIGLTGFDGGELSIKCDINLHVPVRQYGVVEDAHQSIMHCLAKGIRALLNVKGNN